MQKELDTLHARLFLAKKREKKLTAVLITGVPGSGKSHLAREYVCRYRDNYPGGIFWIDAKSRQSIHNCFWDIAQAATLTDEGEFQNPHSKSSSKYIEAVRLWLQSRDEWLLVFDGISFGRDEEINEFKQFLPYKERCGIIYTSVDKTLRRKHRLYEPFCLSISPLEVGHACKFLFKDLGIKRPTQEQIRKATEVVKHYECLPLAIHAISHRLKATDKPIEKYHISSQYYADQKLAEPFLNIMQDLYWRDFYPALNLINLLSFLGHHVPVGLISLGLQFLNGWNVPVLTSSPSSRDGDLDTTLGVLIRYGLIERTSDKYPLLPKTPPPQSEGNIPALDMQSIVPELSESQTESSQEGLSFFYSNAGTTDVIKIHSVVQGFCRDELRKQDEEVASRGPLKDNYSFSSLYESWLFVATGLLCASYENAKDRMDRVDDCGLVKDYREYETHASQLAKHFPRKSSQEIVRRAREPLKHMLDNIHDEIDRISPKLSQESIRKHRSVFDRSSSSSSCPESSGSDIQPRQIMFDISNSVFHRSESPQDLRASPISVNLGPFIPYVYGNRGDSKNDGEGQASVVQQSPPLPQISQVAGRPKTSQTSINPCQVDKTGWCTVEPPSKGETDMTKKRKKGLPPRIQVPEPIPPFLERTPVQGQRASSDDAGERSRSHISASQALAAVHMGRPKLYSEDIRQPIAIRPSSNAGKENIPIYTSAQNLSIQAKQRSASSPGGPTRPKLMPELQSKSSVESFYSESSNLLLSSRSVEFGPESLAHSTYSEPDSRYYGYGITNPGRVDLSASTPSIFTGLPYDSNVSMSKRAWPIASSVPNVSSSTLGLVSHPSAIMPGASPLSAQALDMHADYRSEPGPEPMSRGPSGNSHHSWSTEPAHRPARFSPLPPNLGSVIGIHRPTSSQQVLSGTGSWVPDMQQHPQLGPIQMDPTHASMTDNRHIHTLDHNIAVLDPIWDPNPDSTQPFSAHRVDIHGAHKRLSKSRQHHLRAPQHAMFHDNRSGPLIPHEVSRAVQETRAVRARSGSSPSNPRFDFQ